MVRGPKKPVEKGELPLERQRHAKHAIEEFVSWHMCGVATRSLGKLPEVGSATAIRWKRKTLLLTANHVVKDVPNYELEFAFRPTGTLERPDWWQSTDARPQTYLRARHLEIVQRHTSTKDDLCALEVQPELENQNVVRFFELSAESKIVWPTGSNICAIGLPFDSLEQMAPGTVAFQVTVHWGELEPVRRKLLSGFNRRKHLLLQFPPANTGRHPGGFSGAGAWYHASSAKPPEVWSFRPVLAGVITHFYLRPKLLRITRVESLVAFLQTIA
jgi:hypothetical protein